MIVDHTGALHKGVTRSRPNKFESFAFERLRHSFRVFRFAQHNFG